VSDGALTNTLVVAVEQAVAAPYCTSRLADAGAEVIKIERPEGDFARGYDHVVHGESAYFVWLNRGKKSIVVDLKDSADRDFVLRMLGKADVFVQNLVPGAADRLGLGSTALRECFPRLITCDISGYGESGRYASMKAYDLIVQCETGLASITGTPEARRVLHPSRARPRARDAWACRPAISHAVCTRTLRSSKRCCAGSRRARAARSRCRSFLRWPIG